MRTTTWRESFDELCDGGLVEVNPSTGEVLDTYEKFEADKIGMFARAEAERAAGIEPRTLEHVLGSTALEPPTAIDSLA